jgi:hypothetical protein
MIQLGGDLLKLFPVNIAGQQVFRELAQPGSHPAPQLPVLINGVELRANIQFHVCLGLGQVLRLSLLHNDVSRENMPLFNDFG